MTAARAALVAGAVVAALIGGTAAATAATAKKKNAAHGDGDDKKTAASPAPAATAPAPVDIDALLNQFAKAPGLAAHFREEKHLSLLDAPVINEGRIGFQPPGRFVRHTETPIASTLLIDGGRLQFGDADGGKQSMELGTNPVAKLFVDSFVMILAGDRAGLEKVFAIKLTRPRPVAPRVAGDWC